MKFIITTGHCDHEGQPPKPSDKTIEIIFGNVWRGPIGDIADAEREAWDAKETPEGAQAKADAAQQAATATAAEALKSHADDAEIHKTSEHIRADIVEDDIPMTIARTMDVDADIATALDKAKAYTDDAVAGKAEAEATSTALAGKVDKVDGAGLMTDEEREKLAGIEADANAYVLPTASAEVLGGIKVGNNLSMREDGTLDAEAGGGGTVTVSPDAGNTLEQRENGLFVPVGNGGGGESSVLVLPYVAAETDDSGTVTNSEAFVTAWSAILSRYLAAPDRYALYMEMDGGGGLMLRLPCNMVNMGGDADTVQWLLSGFAAVNIPATADSSVSCKATAMAMVVCNPAGDMLALAMYAATGLVGTDGQPNLLGGDDPVIVNIPDNATEDQLKEILKPALSALQVNPRRRVIVQYGVILIPATTAITDADFLIAAMDAHPFTANNPNSTMVVKVTVYCRLSNGVIQSASGGVSGFEVATMEAMNTALAAKAALVPFSLTEQPVPGEFWDGEQVYQRSFKGNTGNIAFTLSTGILEAILVNGYVGSPTNDRIPYSYIVSQNGIGVYDFNWNYFTNSNGELRIKADGTKVLNQPYCFTFKYTKV